MHPRDDVSRIKRSAASEASIAFLLLGFVGGIAVVLRVSFGEARFADLMVLSALMAGALFSLRVALTVAGLAYLTYVFIRAGSPLARMGGALDDVALLAFIVAPLSARASVRVLRKFRWRAASWSRTMRTVMEASAFFAVTPNEDAIREALAQAVSALVEADSVVSDREGRPRFRAGTDRTNEVDGELQRLVDLVIRMAPDQVLTRGGYCGRLLRSADEILGVAIWRRPGWLRARIHGSDECIELLMNIACAAIVRASGIQRIRTQSSEEIAWRGQAVSLLEEPSLTPGGMSATGQHESIVT